MFLVHKYWQTGSFKSCQKAFRAEFLRAKELLRKQNPRQEIEAITEETLIKVFRNLERRVQMCSDEGGDHFQHQM